MCLNVLQRDFESRTLKIASQLFHNILQSIAIGAELKLSNVTEIG